MAWTELELDVHIHPLGGPEIHGDQAGRDVAARIRGPEELQDPQPGHRQRAALPPGRARARRHAHPGPTSAVCGVKPVSGGAHSQSTPGLSRCTSHAGEPGEGRTNRSLGSPGPVKSTRRIAAAVRPTPCRRGRPPRPTGSGACPSRPRVGRGTRRTRRSNRDGVRRSCRTATRVGAGDRLSASRSARSQIRQSIAVATEDLPDEVLVGRRRMDLQLQRKLGCSIRSVRCPSPPPSLRTVIRALVV